MRSLLRYLENFQKNVDTKHIFPFNYKCKRFMKSFAHLRSTQPRTHTLTSFKVSLSTS
jgi:hypothetical protein